MHEDSLEFSWWVHPRGYHFVETVVWKRKGEAHEVYDPESGTFTDRQLVLAPNQPLDIWPRMYFPMKDAPALFKTFADISLDDKKEIVEFANTYGHLGIPVYTHETKSDYIQLARWDERWGDW